MNWNGLVDGKYGAKIQLSVHRRRRTLQAAQGPWLAAGKEDDLEEEEEDDEEGEEKEENKWILLKTLSGFVVFSVYSILWEGGRERERLIYYNTKKWAIEVLEEKSI